MADTPATLDDVVAALNEVKASIDALKTELTAQMAATNANLSYIGSGAAVETGVVSDREFVVSPWPPEEAEEETGTGTE